MNSDTLMNLNGARLVEHPHFAHVFAEVLRHVQYGRADEPTCVIGPTGVGKTTLQNALVDYLIRQQYTGWRPSSSPPVILEAPAQYSGDFPWRSFMEDLLLTLGEPDLKSKVDLDRIEEAKRSKQAIRGTTRLNIAQIESLVRKRIKALGPVVIFIDEAQNIVEGLSVAKRKQNVNRIKNWANTMNTKFVLFGTHEAKDLLNLNEQLARRIAPIYFPRYRGLEQEEVQQFMDFYKALVEEFDLKMTRDVGKDYQYIYNHSLGCPGLLVSWLHDAISYCIDKNLSSISKRVLKKTQKSHDRLHTIELAIKEFEAYYESTLQDFNPYLVFPENVQMDLQSNASVIKRPPLPPGWKPGQQHPTRHQVHANRGME